MYTPSFSSHINQWVSWVEQCWPGGDEYILKELQSRRPNLHDNLWISITTDSAISDRFLGWSYSERRLYIHILIAARIPDARRKLIQFQLLWWIGPEIIRVKNAHGGITWKLANIFEKKRACAKSDVAYHSWKFLGQNGDYCDVRRRSYTPGWPEYLYTPLISPSESRPHIWLVLSTTLLPSIVFNLSRALCHPVLSLNATLICALRS